MAGVGNSGGGGGGGGAIRAGRAYVEMYANDSAVLRSLERLKARFQSFAGLTIKAGLALGAGGAVALAPLKAAIDTLDEQGKTLGAANALGIDPKAASELFGIMKAGGSDLRDATEGLATFGQRIEEGLSGKGEVAAELFDKLGVSAAEFKSLSPDQAFYKLLDSIKANVPETERLNVLMKAVGEDTGKNLANTLSLSAEQMRDLAAASSMSAEDMKRAQDASVSWKIATATLGSVWGQVAQALAPVISSFAQWLKSVVQPFAAWVKENQAYVVIAVKVAAGMAAAGAALVGLGLAAKLGAIALGGVVLVMKGIALAVAAVLSPVGLVVAAIGGLGALFFTQTEMGRTAAGHLGTAFQNVGDTFRETWGGIAAAVQKGDLELAFKIAGAGIKAAWFELLNGLTKAWADFGRSVVAGPLGQLDRFMSRVTGITTIDMTTWEKLFSGFEKLNGMRAEAARAELATLTALAKAPTPAKVPDELKYLNYAAAGVSKRVGVTGSFTAAMAAQRFSLASDIPLKQLQEQKLTNKQLDDIKVAMALVGRAFAFK